jgi:hypothetical protein
MKSHEIDTQPFRFQKASAFQLKVCGEGRVLYEKGSVP